MAWAIRVSGITHSSDDFTIEELGEVERVTDVPWSIANPLREVKVAKAFIAVVLLREGLSKDAVADRLEALTLKELKTTFEWLADDDAPVEEVAEPDPSVPSPEPTSRASSTGGRAGAGRPAKPAKSA